MQRVRKLVVLSCVLALVLGVSASNQVVPAPPQPATASASSGGPGLWQWLLGHLGIGQERSDATPAVAAAAARPLPQLGPVAKPVAAKPVGPPRRVRELAGRRSATRRVFALSDGRLQAEVSAAPLYYQDAGGGWQPIDTRVRPSQRAGYAYGNQTNSFQS